MGRLTHVSPAFHDRGGEEPARGEADAHGGGEAGTASVDVGNMTGSLLPGRRLLDAVAHSAAVTVSPVRVFVPTRDAPPSPLRHFLPSLRLPARAPPVIDLCYIV